ncbi:MAG: LytTR family transcriptional regulator DNA-binding domain-containing protein [Eubacteriaceae bacterium]|nr:LytTR family transcriptional regulator DNA-binding domain-containing protein [Eubacteriaceae bacterium]
MAKQRRCRLAPVGNRLFLFVGIGSDIHRICPEHILYCLQNNKKVQVFYLEDGETRCLEARGKMCELAEELSRFRRYPAFYLCHSYWLVNFAKIIKISGETVLFEGGTAMTAGVNQIRALRKAFRAWVRNE